jgi:hypothetical protein
MKYFFNVLVSTDQLGNTICGGNPDNTISARVGYFSQKPVMNMIKRGYWKSLEKVINFTFWPIDGPNHCQQAYEADKDEVFNDNNHDWARFLLSLVIVITCIPISILLYTAWLLKKILRID